MKLNSLVSGIVLSATLVLCFQNCNRGAFEALGTNGDSGSEGKSEVQGENKTLIELDYFFGNTYSALDVSGSESSLNATQFSIVFSTDGTATLSKRSSGQTCFADKKLSTNETASLLALVKSIRYAVKKPTPLVRADGSFSYVNLKYEGRSSPLTLYIDASVIQESGINVITAHAEELSNAMQKIWKNETDVPYACESLTVSNIDSIEFFRGGWYGPYPNWSHHYAVSLTNGLLKVILSDPYCKSMRTLGSSELTKLNNILSSPVTSFVPSTLSIADQGYESVTLNFKNGSPSRQIIISGNGPAQKSSLLQFVSGSSSVADFFKSLPGVVPVLCQ